MQATGVNPVSQKLGLQYFVGLVSNCSFLFFFLLLVDVHVPLHLSGLYLFTGGTLSLTTDNPPENRNFPSLLVKSVLSFCKNSLDLLDLNYFLFLIKIDTDMRKTTKDQDITD